MNTMFKGGLQRLIRAYPSLNLRIEVSKQQHEANVVLPGLRFEDIIFTGQPDIWRLYDMMGRVEFASFFNEYPFLNYTTLYSLGLGSVTKAVNLEVRSHFYELTTPKSPLDMSMKLIHIGENSFTILTELRCGGRQRPSIKVKSLYVLFNRKDGSKQAVPDWWREHFSKHVSHSDGRPFFITPFEKPNQTYSHVFTVPLVDTDVRLRTRCASYVRYFLDNASVASYKDFYSNISTSFHEFHIKKLCMLYRAPSSWGDTLTAETWEDPDDLLTLHCEVSDKGHRRWYGSMSFHSEIFGLPGPTLKNMEA
ncbi:uncharacterized protein LOC121388862 [Gigantopelta aegis]|uniref:uncharacterized protein LOC121388862 n=1 Tax=Gigantopelta aegis TaxID=1735272 RepID=UPI001B88B283|nr:uncharacterized protein LOC121388862 [Gigantopelta aegis]